MVLAKHTHTRNQISFMSIYSFNALFCVSVSVCVCVFECHAKRISFDLFHFNGGGYTLFN